MRITEEQMFRVVLIVGAAMVPVILLALLIDPLVGAIAFGIEIGAAIGYLIHLRRSLPPREAEVRAVPNDGVHRILVVANETVGGRSLLNELRGRLEGERNSAVMVIVPPLAKSAAQHWSSDIDEGVDEAQERLDASLVAMREAGMSVEGHLADHHDPNQAIEDALKVFPADEVIISTHPEQRSRWLESGVVTQARETLPQPVTHVTVDLDAERAGQA